MKFHTGDRFRGKGSMNYLVWEVEFWDEYLQIGTANYVGETEENGYPYLSRTDVRKDSFYPRDWEFIGNFTKASNSKSLYQKLTS